MSNICMKCGKPVENNAWAACLDCQFQMSGNRLHTYQFSLECPKEASDKEEDEATRWVNAPSVEAVKWMLEKERIKIAEGGISVISYHETQDDGLDAVVDHKGDIVKGSL